MGEDNLEKKFNSLLSKFDVLLNVLNNGALSSPQKTLSKYSLYEWIEEWYKTYKVPKLKPHSLICLRSVIDKHIKPNIEDKNLSELEGLEIQKALNKISLSRTRKTAYNIYNGSLMQALKLKIISENIMLSVDGVSHVYNQGVALTKEQQEMFFNIIKGNPYKDVYKFYVYSACRLSEGVNIKWTDVDFIKKTIRIRGTKTKDSDRFIPLFPIIEKLLEDKNKKTEFVFNCKVQALKTNFRRVKEKYDLSFRFHDLRHTFATRCLENGISLKTTQKWLGHSRLDTTANVYTHVTTAFERKETLKFKP